MIDLKVLEKFCNITITYNEHKIGYRNVADYIREYKIPEEDFISREDLEKCVKEDKIWEMQIYPTTPIGSYTIYGSDLEIMIKYMLPIIKEKYGI